MRKKKQGITLWVILGLLTLILLARVLLPYTSVSFISWIRTASTLGFQKQTFKLTIGESITLRVNRVNVRVSYSSSNFRVAYVNKNGKVTALREGTALIYGKIGNETVVCRIRVKE